MDDTRELGEDLALRERQVRLLLLVVERDDQVLDL